MKKNIAVALVLALLLIANTALTESQYLMHDKVQISFPTFWYIYGSDDSDKDLESNEQWRVLIDNLKNQNEDSTIAFYLKDDTFIIFIMALNTVKSYGSINSYSNVSDDIIIRSMTKTFELVLNDESSEFKILKTSETKFAYYDENVSQNSISRKYYSIQNGVMIEITASIDNNESLPNAVAILEDLLNSIKFV